MDTIAALDPISATRPGFVSIVRHALIAAPTAAAIAMLVAAPWLDEDLVVCGWLGVAAGLLLIDRLRGWRGESWSLAAATAAIATAFHWSPKVMAYSMNTNYEIGLAIAAPIMLWDALRLVLPFWFAGSQGALQAMELAAGILDFNDVKRASQKRYVTATRMAQQYDLKGPKSLEDVQANVAAMLEAAGIPSDGLSGAVRQNGLAAIYFDVSRTFDSDDSGDLSKTMAALDGRLKTAERWTQSIDKYTDIRRFRRREEASETPAA